MFTVEFHDHDIDDTVLGTLLARAGRKNGIDYEYQAEMYVESELDPALSRAYILRNGVPFAAWSYGKLATLLCVGHSPEYGGAMRIETPYLYPDAMLLEAGKLGKDIASADTAEDWAHSQLIGRTATAIIYDDSGIVSAWEGTAKKPLLVARGPARQES